jgi:tetraacyldisaccharide 4'-kinase
MSGGLQQAWMRRGALACLLWPVSSLYGLLVRIRRAAYAAGVAASHRPPVPVIVVGNLVAGGAGKTPVVVAVVQHLQERGIRPGVVSRGHGRASRGSVEVTATSQPRDSGDEPLLIARRCGVPVVVDADRPSAVRKLLESHPDVQAIVSDDGLQHLALQRDIEILVFDERGVGNGWLLPAGPLREPPRRKADIVLRPATRPDIAGHAVRRRLASRAVRADGAQRTLADFAGEPCIALAAIAQPQAFFTMLRQAGVSLADTIALPDHDAISELPVRAVAAHPLLCTEKDAAKIWRLRPDAWAVPLEVEIEASFWRELDALLDAKLSSTHGSQTA